MPTGRRRRTASSAGNGLAPTPRMRRRRDVGLQERVCPLPESGEATRRHAAQLLRVDARTSSRRGLSALPAVVPESDAFPEATAHLCLLIARRPHGRAAQAFGSVPYGGGFVGASANFTEPACSAGGGAHSTRAAWRGSSPVTPSTTLWPAKERPSHQRIVADEDGSRNLLGGARPVSVGAALAVGPRVSHLAIRGQGRTELRDRANSSNPGFLGAPVRD
jgi:hypothetical protein